LVVINGREVPAMADLIAIGYPDQATATAKRARRDVLRLAKALTLAAALLAALTAGIVIGGAARKKFYQATRGYT
jgi:hypothetical protein